MKRLPLRCLSPPTSTLFPYTTLFRSQDRGLHAAHPAAPVAEWRERYTASAHPRPDRKSTRLNSSHPSNSYAVFCLKKKSHILNLQLRILQYYHLGGNLQ